MQEEDIIEGRDDAGGYYRRRDDAEGRTYRREG